MSELSELSGECEDFGEYNHDCICDELKKDYYEPPTCADCWHRADYCVCEESATAPEPVHGDFCPCESCN